MLEIFLNVLYFLYGFSVFTSKSGLTLLGALLFLLSLAKIDWPDFIKNQRLLLAFFLVYPIGAFLNLFSLGGYQSSLSFLANFSWILLIFPALVAFQKSTYLKNEALGALLGLFIGGLYSLYKITTQPTIDRVDSFWDIGRWGSFTSAALVILFGTMLTPHFFKQKKLTSATILLITLLTGLSLILTQSRAPWLSGIIGIATFAFFNRKARLYSLIPAGILFILFFLSPDLQKRATSIFQVQTQNGMITSSDASNAGRLHMWKVASDLFLENIFFGVGFHNSEDPLKKFLSKKGEKYSTTYVMKEFSFHDQHSSYLSSLVQNGLLFSLIFWGFFALLAINAIKGASQNHWTLTFLALFLNYAVNFIFYSSYESYEMVLLIPAITYLALSNRSKVL